MRPGLVPVRAGGSYPCGRGPGGLWAGAAGWPPGPEPEVRGSPGPRSEILESVVGPLVENAVPEWRFTLDALLELPEIDGPVGYSGGWAALGIALAVAEPRVVAAGPFAGG